MDDTGRHKLDLRRCDRPRGWGEYHPRMGDVLLVLVVIFVVVLVWRGPKTLPKLGQALGRGVKQARHELDSADPETPEPPDAADRP
jgi:hypothetical protein